jgi:hypothetical protein
MSDLGKLLALWAQECEQQDADCWNLALTNGAAMAVTARRDQGFLLLDADAGVSPAPELLAPLAERAHQLPAAVKFALRGPHDLRLRAEVPLPDGGSPEAGRVREHLDGMRSASHQLRDWLSREAAGTEVACPEPQGEGQANPGSMTELLSEAGWQYHERPGGALLADLEAGSQFLQAAVERCGAGARFHLTLYRHDAPGDTAWQALCLYLLEANATLRYARAFVRRQGEAIEAGFEVRMETGPSAAETGHALAALSVAGRHCAREMEVLKDGAVAGIYRSARLPASHQIKGD